MPKEYGDTGGLLEDGMKLEQVSVDYLEGGRRK
jgi:hypothetical protein